MAHFLMCPFGSGGDVYPFIGIGRALVARGHRVTVLSMEVFERAILAAGLGYVSMGTRADYERLMEHPDLWKPIAGTKLVFATAAQYVRPLYERLCELIVPGEPTLILSAGSGFGARLAREKLGVPLIVLHLQPAVFISAYDTPKFIEGPHVLNALPVWLKKLMFKFPNPMDQGVLPTVRRECRSEKLPPPRRVHPDWWHSPDGNVALFPAWFAAPQPDWPQPLLQHSFPMEDLATNALLSAELEQFLAAGEKPIVFTPGTGNHQAKAFFKAALAACELLKCRAVFATQHESDVPVHLPPSILVQRYAPFSLLLPRAAALVYHGGIGTCSQALAAGIPHLIMPLAHDQPDNANRLRRLGIGLSLHPKKFTGERVAAALRHLLKDNAVQANCTRYAEQMRVAPSLDELAAWLEARVGV